MILWHTYKVAEVYIAPHTVVITPVCVLINNHPYKAYSKTYYDYYVSHHQL